MSELLEKGAEAEIYKKDDKVIKIRKPKKYRANQLDKKIRKERTKKEAKITKDARKIGVRTPIILDIDEYKITFEYIHGNKLKEIFPKLKKQEHQEIGKNLAKLHKKGMFHGDLTTSNILRSNKRNKICFIDFGLAGYDEHIEPKGVDLHVLFQTIRSSHPAHKKSIDHILSGYKSTIPSHNEIIKRLREIEKRGRYF